MPAGTSEATIGVFVNVGGGPLTTARRLASGANAVKDLWKPPREDDGAADRCATLPGRTRAAHTGNPNTPGSFAPDQMAPRHNRRRVYLSNALKGTYGHGGLANHQQA